MQDLHEPVIARPGDDAPARIGPVRQFGRWLLAAIILILALFIYWKYFFTYSEGNRTGLLQKFSYRGTLFKTY